MKKCFAVNVLLGFFILLIGCGQTTVTQPSGGTSDSTLVFNGIVSASRAELGSSNEVQIAWNAATSESSATYYIYHSTAETQVFTTTAVSTSGVISYIVKSLEPDTPYYFGVRAGNEFGSFETNTLTKVATTGVVTGSMKNCFPYTMFNSGNLRFIGAKFFGLANTNGLVKANFWYYVISNNSTIEIWKASDGSTQTKLATTEQPYDDILQTINLNNNLLPPTSGIDSYALMKIVYADSTVKNWIQTHPTYNTNGATIIIYTYGEINQSPIWVVTLDEDQTGKNRQPITINAITGAVIGYE